jgi:8-oxo-dGTP pyrophosphatase MutT (NUDIX family)
MSDLSIATIEERIRSYQPTRYEVGEKTRLAAVAAVLRQQGAETQALFILRARKDGDPWSGHMAFPGGHKDPEDSDLQETAVRETLEELNVDLVKHGRLLGRLEHVKANPGRANIDMVVTPYVYLLEGEPEIVPNEEVADYHWGSLQKMFSGEALTSREFQVPGGTQSFPGYDVEGEIVWGLTYRVLDHFFNLLDPNWERREF